VVISPAPAEGPDRGRTLPGGARRPLAFPRARAEYLRSGDFWESTAENWESEFLHERHGRLAVIAPLLAVVEPAGDAVSDPRREERGSPESKPVDAAHAENEA
jgi:hypothetical protein